MCFGVKLQAQNTARVIRVKDGDTYVLQTENRQITVRLNKIDAPELKQNGGVSAAKFVSSLILGKNIVYDSTGKDKYGRVLANATINGLRLDSIIIRNGWAWHYVNYDKETMLDNAMQEAITEHLGIWKCGTLKVCPAWLWRSYNDKNKEKYCKGCKTIS